jgi:hypothetical protein
MSKPLKCSAGGEFDLSVTNPQLPDLWVSDQWEAKADPNRGDCLLNGYGNIL